VPALTGARIGDCPAERVDEAVALLESAWDAPPGAGPVTAPMLHTLRQTGACVRIAEDPVTGRLSGAAIAFACTDRPSTLHLHVVGVPAAEQGHGLGRALLVDVGRWAADRGLRAVEWTFDPLVRRNAHLYLRTFPARVVRYLEDPYGDLADGINAGQGSDRLLVEWDLADEGHGPAPAAGPGAIVVEVPADIEGLRRTAPAAAAAWRARTRAALGRDELELLGLDDADRYVARHRATDLIDGGR